MRLSSHDELETFNGFDELETMIEDYLKSADDSNVDKELEMGAKEFVDILLKLPRPKSNISYPGYTHLIDCFTYARNSKGEYEVGWGKYYGPMVENGTVKMKKSIPHMNPAWEKNKKLVFEKMIEMLERR